MIQDEKDTVPDLAFVPVDDREDEKALREVLAELVQRRKDLGLTQPDMAKKLGTRTNRVNAQETGSDGQLRVTTLQRYARALGTRLRLTLDPADGESSVDGQQ